MKTLAGIHSTCWHSPRSSSHIALYPQMKAAFVHVDVFGTGFAQQLFRHVIPSGFHCCEILLGRQVTQQLQSDESTVQCCYDGVILPFEEVVDVL